LLNKKNNYILTGIFSGVKTKIYLKRQMDPENLLANDEFIKKSKCRMKIFLSLIIILFSLCIAFIILYIIEKNSSKENNEEEKKDIDNPLSLWNDCDPKNKLIEFMAKINSKEKFVPKEDRIAVFDLDGTLFQETDPTYDDWKLYYYRVYNDPNFEPTEEQKIIADEIDISSKNNTMPDDLNLKIAQTYAQLFNTMTLEQYQQYIKDFVSQPAEGYENLKRGDAFYKPMLELIEYLQKNDFNVFISSGTDRYQVRTVIEGHINIPKGNVIGSDYEVITTNQGEENAYEYEYKKDDEFKFEGKFLKKNLKTNKIIGIIREIGKQPLLAFGNSGGDSCMANYAINNNKYESLAFMVCCDDLERERGNLEKAEKMKENCRINNWIAISMKDHWKTIYGENVIKKN